MQEAKSFHERILYRALLPLKAAQLKVSENYFVSKKNPLRTLTQGTEIVSGSTLFDQPRPIHLSFFLRGSTVFIGQCPAVFQATKQLTKTSYDERFKLSMKNRRFVFFFDFLMFTRKNRVGTPMPPVAVRTFQIAAFGGVHANHPNPKLGSEYSAGVRTKIGACRPKTQHKNSGAEREQNGAANNNCQPNL